MPKRTILICGLILTLVVWEVATLAQPQNNLPLAEPQAKNADPAHLEFEIVESIDAEYLGDTPAHTGRRGGLTFQPHIALGDPVFRGDKKIGRVSSVTWDRARGGLTIELSPHPLMRIAVGDVAWVDVTEKNKGSDELADN